MRGPPRLAPTSHATGVFPSVAGLAVAAALSFSPAVAGAQRVSPLECSDRYLEYAAKLDEPSDQDEPQPPPGNSTPENVVRYGALLRKLGAVRVLDLDKTGEDGRPVTEWRSKSIRQDVHGWLSPTRARLAQPNRHAGPSLMVADLEAIIDLSEYRRTRDPLLWTALVFAIGELTSHPLSQTGWARLLEAYGANLDLETAVRKSLDGKLTGSQLMLLYAASPSPLLFYHLPPLDPNDRFYREFLLECTRQANLGNYRRFLAHSVLGESLAEYRAEMLEFASRCISQMRSPYARLEALRSLLALDHPAAYPAIDHALRHDSWVEVRNELLRWLSTRRQEHLFADALLFLALGKGSRCGLAGCCEPGTYLERALRRTLDAALARLDLSPTARATLEQASRELPLHDVNCSIWGKPDTG